MLSQLLFLKINLVLERLKFIFPRNQLFPQLGNQPSLIRVSRAVHFLSKVIFQNLGEEKSILDLRFCFGDRHRGSQHLLHGLGERLPTHARHHFAEQGLQPLGFLGQHLYLGVLGCLMRLVPSFAHCLVQVVLEFVHLLRPLEALSHMFPGQGFVFALQRAYEPVSVQVCIDTAQLRLESFNLLARF